MSDSNRLLELIEEVIVAHGGDLGGWTRAGEGTLQLFDGRVTLRAELEQSPESKSDNVVHAHVLTTLHEYDDEVLDACLFGIGDDREKALGQAAFIWTSCVAGPIRSFLDNKPVCMTCQAGVHDGDEAAGYSRGDYGLPGLRAYVGPSIARGFEGSTAQSALDDAKPWFRFAAESAAPRRVHLAKATINSLGKDGWQRDLEIDGHDVSYREPNWPAGVRGPDVGYVLRYAVFEFPANSAEIRKRAELERTIRFFAENYTRHENIDSLMNAMVGQGFDPELVHETESFSTIAFGRTLFEHLGIKYSPTVIRARRDGRVETDVPLMSIPAYTRARALVSRLRETMPQDQFEALCCYNAESHAILQALESEGDDLDLKSFELFPSVVPDHGVDSSTMDAAMILLDELVVRRRLAGKTPSVKNIAEEVLTPGYFNRAMERAQRRKSPWNLMLLVVGLCAMVFFAFAMFRIMWRIHTAFYPEHAGKFKEFWNEGISFRSFLSSFLLLIPPLIAAVPLGLMLANAVCWCIPPARRAFEREAEGVKWASFGQAMRTLSLLALIIVPACILLSFIGAATLSSLR